MCGRYLIDEEQSEEIHKIIQEVQRRHGEDAVKTGEIFPTNSAPILTAEKQGPLAPRPAKWGFPHFKGSGQIINARAEGVLGKNMFRKPILERRCAIPTTGFYEWKQIEGQKKKDKYLFAIPRRNTVYLAGFTNIFRDGAERYEAYVVLTTQANDSMAPYHHRMPVILTEDELEQWVSDTDFMQRILGRVGPELVSIRCE